MADHVRNRDWLDAEELESSAPGLPRPDLNPLVNPLLGKNMGRWAQVYFTSPPEQREMAVEKLVQELQAESGNKKAPRPEMTGVGQGAASRDIPKSRPELEFPELPMQGSAYDERDLRPTLVPDLVECFACLHKNPAEQRFCGICGAALNREVAGGTPEIAAPQAVAKAENADSDWQWLRERTLSSYEVKNESRGRSGFVLLALVGLAISVGAYFLWQNRALLAHEQAPPASGRSSETPATPSMTVPMSAEPSSAPLPQNPAANRQTQLPSPKTAGKSFRQNTAKAAGSESSGTSPADDGRDDLDKARQYLEGEGVPKNSWMASQLLWKAIGKQNSEAVLLLSDLYARGDGVPRSCEQARILLISAAKKGSSAAARKLRSVETGCR